MADNIKKVLSWDKKSNAYKCVRSKIRSELFNSFYKQILLKYSQQIPNFSANVLVLFCHEVMLSSNESIMYEILGPNNQWMVLRQNVRYSSVLFSS
jgi:hypothetical protein